MIMRFAINTDMTDTDELADKYVLNIDDISDILNIGNNKAYELAGGDYFPTKRLSENGQYLIPKKSFFEWLNNSQDEILG